MPTYLSANLHFTSSREIRAVSFRIISISAMLLCKILFSKFNSIPFRWRRRMHLLINNTVYAPIRINLVNLSTFSVGKINVALISTDILTVGISGVVCISSSAFSLEIEFKLVIGQDLLSKLHQVGPLTHSVDESSFPLHPRVPMSDRYIMKPSIVLYEFSFYVLLGFSRILEAIWMFSANRGRLYCHQQCVYEFDIITECASRIPSSKATSSKRGIVMFLFSGVNSIFPLTSLEAQQAYAFVEASTNTYNDTGQFKSVGPIFLGIDIDVPCMLALMVFHSFISSSLSESSHFRVLQKSSRRNNLWFT
uniref:BPI2 domain-containing protein n=1 Tax=Heterorhabditis bacteriophora TaxID=37862 RepID=A0A1I7WGP5_HETBA